MSVTHSPSQRILTKRTFDTAITAASNNGTGVDALGARFAQAVFQTTPSGASTTSVAKLQDSPDNTTFTDVANAVFATVITSGATGAQLNAPALQVMDIDLSKRARYLRLVHTGAGGSAAGNAVGVIQLFNESYQPVAQDNTPVAV